MPTASIFSELSALLCKKKIERRALITAEAPPRLPIKRVRVSRTALNGEYTADIPCSRKEITFSVLSLTENTLKLSLPLRASEVYFVSEVHFVSEVSPDGEVMGKLNFTANFGEQLHCVSHNFTFATAKTSLTEKEQTYKIFCLACLLFLLV